MHCSGKSKHLSTPHECLTTTVNQRRSVKDRQRRGETAKVATRLAEGEEVEDPQLVMISLMTHPIEPKQIERREAEEERW